VKRILRVITMPFAMLCLFVAAGCGREAAVNNSHASAGNAPAAANTARQAAANSANTAPPAPKPNRPAPDFTVTARDLLKETQANAEKAGARYEGRQIAVTGTVTLTDVSESPATVHLSAGAPPDFVVGYFEDGEKERVAALKDEQKVTMQCEGGSLWTGLPDLNKCIIINVE
jgi:hypothetical protein